MANSAYEHIAELKRILIQAHIARWLQVDLHNWHFWFLAVLLIAPWPLWFKLTDKTRLRPIVLFFLFYTVFTITLDEIYTSIPLRTYTFLLIPIIPRILPLDYTIIPMIFTLIYQSFGPWKSFLGVTCLGAAFISFVGEPLAALTGFYVLVKWNYFCPFPNFIVMSVVAKWLVDKLVSAEIISKK